nr:M56 family metallopeptidase [Fusibacter paucivorans]
MDTVFLKILNMSYTASYVILAVLLIRLLIKKAPKRFSYTLWSVVLFRLICPWSFESAFSLLSIGGRTTEQFQPLPEQFVTLGTVHSSVITNGDGIMLAPVSHALKEPLFDNIFTLIWLIGIATLMIYNLMMMLKLKKQLKGAVHDTENIYLSANLSTPFVMGVIQPKIYLPLSLSKTEKRYILLHEQTHIRRLDYLIKLVSFLVLCIHWFNPLAWVAFFLSGRDMEMSCDETVIKKLGNDVKKEYSASLLSLAVERRMIGGTPLAFGEGDTKSRIKNVLNYKKQPFWIAVIAIVFCGTMIVGLMANPRSKAIIMTNNALYESNRKTVGALPANAYEIGTLDSILHIPGSMPEHNFQGVGLDEKYAGNHLYQSGLNENIIYLEDFEGFYISFVKQSQNSTAPSSATSEITENSEKSTPSQHIALSFFIKPDEPVQVIGETAANIWLKSHMEENIASTERIADYTINAVTVIAGDPKVGQKWTDMEYHYVVRVNYDIATASEEYFAPGDGASGKGTFQNLFRELYVKALGTGNFEIAGVGTDGGEQAFIDPLELAISAAILDREKDSSSSEFLCESHVTLMTERHSPTGNSENVDMVTVYTMVLVQKYDFVNDGLDPVGGSHIPTAITFDVNKSGNYLLKEYWIPRDGSYYGPDIKEKFPPAIWADALDTQKYILAQIQNSYAQAIIYKQLDTTSIIENLFDRLMSSPAGSSNPEDYIVAHRLDYRELTYYGDYTLQYIFSEFLKGGQIGLKGRLMRIVMDDLIANDGMPIAAESGQAYFNTWREHGQNKLSAIGEDEMRERYPKSYLMLTMLPEME